MNIETTVDTLGQIRAEMARLKEVEAELVGQLKSAPVGAYEGSLFRATVSQIADRETLDAKAAEEKLRELGVDGRWFSKNMKVVSGYTMVKVSARKGN